MKRSKEASRVVWGVLLIAMGLVFLVERQGWIANVNIQRLWPAFLILVGTVSFLYPREDGRRHGLGLAFLGGLFLLHTYRILLLHESWPLFIVWGGLSLIFDRKRHDGRVREEVVR